MFEHMRASATISATLLRGTCPFLPSSPVTYVMRRTSYRCCSQVHQAVGMALQNQRHMGQALQCHGHQESQDVRVLRPQDPSSGAKTLLYRVDVDRGVSWADAHTLLMAAPLRSSPVRRPTSTGLLALLPVC